MRPRISIRGSVRRSVRPERVFFEYAKARIFDSNRRGEDGPRGRGWFGAWRGRRGHKHTDTYAQTDRPTHAHANSPPKRTTVRMPRRRGTHLTFGVTKLVVFGDLFVIEYACNVLLAKAFSPFSRARATDLSDQKKKDYDVFRSLNNVSRAMIDLPK